MKLIPQTGGTLAGPDVPYGLKWDSAWSKKNSHLMMFPFLYDVQRAVSQGGWNVRWDLENYPNMHLRLHGLGAGGDVALSKGKPPGGGKPYELQFVTRHRTGTAPLATQFVEVLEAYEGDALFTEVRPLKVTTTDESKQQPVAFQVVSGTRVDTIIHSHNPDVSVTTENGITMTGSFGIWSEDAGEPKRVFLAHGTEIRKAGSRYTAESKDWTGRIVSTNFENKEIVVSPAPREPAKLVGRYARVTNPHGNDATHRIVKSTALDDGRAKLTFEWDPRIAAGPVKEVHEDGLTSGVALKFGGLYYKGKTLSNEDHSKTYQLNGVQTSRAYINSESKGSFTKQTLRRDFADKDTDGFSRFIIYDYGPGDLITVPTVTSQETTTN